MGDTDLTNIAAIAVAGAAVSTVAIVSVAVSSSAATTSKVAESFVGGSTSGGTSGATCAATGAATREVTCENCAWVTLVMRGDSYTGGALTMAYSMRMAGTAAKLVCMVTDDVTEAARAQLRLVFDEVVRVPVISYPCKPLKTEKQRVMYDWVSDGFTKWACLGLTRYRRVCFIDADKIALANCDSIFELRAPAATFSSPWAEPFAEPFAATSATKSAAKGAKGKKRGMYNPYTRCRHGGVVPRHAIAEGFCRDSFVAIGTMMLLEPAEGAVEEFRRFVEGRLPFGEPRCYSMMDEQSITQFYYEKRVPWHFIHQRYNYIPWQRAWLPDVRALSANRPVSDAPRHLVSDAPRIFHYFGRKVWDMPRSAYPDAEAWWRFASAAVRAHPGVAGAFAPALLAEPATPICAWCESNRQRADHDLVDESGRAVCARLLALLKID